MRERPFLLLALTAATTSFAQMATIRVRVLDGHTGKPLVHQGIMAYTDVRATERPPITPMPVTDANGVITATVPLNGNVGAIASVHPTCTHIPKAKRKPGASLVPVSEVLSTGVVKKMTAATNPLPRLRENLLFSLGP